VSIQGVIGFLGFGNMGMAIAEGMVHQGVVSPSQIAIFDPSPDRQHDGRRLGATVHNSAEALAEASDTLILAVKPQMMGEVLRAMGGSLRPEALLVSIAAGLPMHWLIEQTGRAVRLVRVMPNTPALAGAGASGIALGEACTESDKAVVEAIFSAVGLCVFVTEEQLHAVTSLSGSGPAYFFRLVEALESAAVAEGLDRDLARQLAAQTLYGAGMLLHKTGEAAGDLRAKVTSKGGTTEAALRTFSEEGFDEVVRAGVGAAAARSRELGSQLE